jgi:hypothetical protein
MPSSRGGDGSLANFRHIMAPGGREREHLLTKMSDILGNILWDNLAGKILFLRPGSEEDATVRSVEAG